MWYCRSVSIRVGALFHLLMMRSRVLMTPWPESCKPPPMEACWTVQRIGRRSIDLGKHLRQPFSVDRAAASLEHPLTSQALTPWKPDCSMTIRVPPSTSSSVKRTVVSTGPPPGDHQQLLICNLLDFAVHDAVEAGAGSVWNVNRCPSRGSKSFGISQRASSQSVAARRCREGAGRCVRRGSNSRLVSSSAPRPSRRSFQNRS